MSEKYEEKEMTELVESAITVVSSRAGEQFADPLTAARKFCLQFVTTLVHALFKLDIMEEWLDDYVKFIGLIHSVDTMAKLSRYTNDLIRTLADVLHISRDGSGNYLIEQAKQYIKTTTTRLRSDSMRYRERSTFQYLSLQVVQSSYRQQLYRVC